MTIPNQAPDSSVAGFLQSDGSLPVLGGQNLENYLQQYVAGVSYLDGPMVRPRWQPEPPNLPDYGVDWAAVGVMRHRPVGTYPAVIHHREDQGHDEMQRHEELDILCSFYGENADIYAENFHDGLMIWQNISVLRLSGMALVEVSDSTRNPELIRERWWNRIDKPLVLRRIIRRNYPVLNVLSAEAWVNTDGSTHYTAVARVPPQPWVGLRQIVTATTTAGGELAVGLRERAATAATGRAGLAP
jgi:hypothetical protein